MDFTGTVLEVKTYSDRFPSVRIQAHHDPRILTWAEWQTDIRGRDPKVGDYCRVQSYGGLKIAR